MVSDGDREYLKQNPILTYNKPNNNLGAPDELNYLDASYNYHFKEYCRTKNLDQCSFPCNKMNKCCVFKGEFEIYSPGENLLRYQEEEKVDEDYQQILVRLAALNQNTIARNPENLSDNNTCSFLSRMPNYDRVPN